MREAQADQETALIDAALKALTDSTGHSVSIDTRGKTAGADGHLRTADIDVPINIETRSPLTKEKIGFLAYQTKGLPQRALVVSDYVNPSLAQRLKDLDIWFIDTAGNAYINQPPLFVFIKGNKKPEPLGKPPATRAFNPTGLKVLFAFLCEPELVNAPYRDIANMAQVALGSVGWVIADLKEQGFLIETAKRRRKLKNLKKLIERWAEAYPQQLRHKLLIGRFTSAEPVWWKNTRLQALGAYMGGEIAAEYLTHYLKPETITLYVRHDLHELKLAFKLKNDPRGEVELLKPFWDKKYDWKDGKTVHPILIYADLLASGEPRNIETASMIYEQQIAEYLREA